MVWLAFVVRGTDGYTSLLVERHRHARAAVDLESLFQHPLRLSISSIATSFRVLGGLPRWAPEFVKLLLFPRQTRGDIPFVLGKIF